MTLKLESKMNGNEEKIKILQNKISELKKKSTATKKMIPADDAMAKSQGNDPVGTMTKLQFQNKKDAGVLQTKEWSKEMSELTQEIGLLKKTPEAWIQSKPSSLLSNFKAFL